MLGGKLSWLSSAFCLNAKFAQDGDDLAPKTCTRIPLYHSGCYLSTTGTSTDLCSPHSHRIGETYILLTSHAMAVDSCLNLKRTPTRLLVRSGPPSRQSFREVPSNRALASNTMHNLDLSLEPYTPW